MHSIFTAVASKQNVDNSNDSKSNKEVEVGRSTAAEWVKNLYEMGILHVEEDGTIGILFIAELNRSVNTGPIDRLSIYFKNDDLPPILDIKKIDGKRNIVLSIDSNLIPEKIENIQKHSQKWITRFRYLMWGFVLVSSGSFMLEVVFGFQFPNYTAIPRFLIFILSVLLYGLVGRLYVHGVAVGTALSVYGCINCGEVIQREHNPDSEEITVLTCESCTDDMIPLMTGKPSNMEYQSKIFLELIQELVEDSNKK